MGIASVSLESPPSHARDMSLGEVDENDGVERRYQRQDRVLPLRKVVSLLGRSSPDTFGSL